MPNDSIMRAKTGKNKKWYSLCSVINSPFRFFRPIIASFQRIKTYHIPLESSRQAAFDGAGGAYDLCGFYVANRR